MAAHDLENSQQYVPVNSSATEPGETRGNGKGCLCKADSDLKHISPFIIFSLMGSLILNLVLFICVLAVRLREPSPALPTCPEVFCPNDWVGYQGKCYYFAKAEGNWTSSKMHCRSLNATLAVVDSQEEMDFMMRYKGPADHWVGLHRNQRQPWKWINGTIFSEWFTILGGGSCAYMNQQGIASSSCSREEPWICSKPVARYDGTSTELPCGANACVKRCKERGRRLGFKD